MSAIGLVVIGAYFAFMAGMGFWFMRRNNDADAYFKAGGRLPWWVVSLSIYATMFSSITFISVPAMSFTGDMSYFAIASFSLRWALRCGRSTGRMQALCRPASSALPVCRRTHSC